MESSKERYSMLETHHKALKAELDTTREKNTKLSNALSSHQERVSVTTEQLFKVEEKASRLELSYQSLRGSYNLLEASERQARAQYQSLLKEQREHGELMTNLQTIQNNLEKSEFETKTRLGSQIEALERELSLSRDRIHSEEDRRSKMAEAYDTQVRRTPRACLGNCCWSD